jgi:hypothetical protein
MDSFITIDGQNFYFNEVELYHGRKKIDKKTAKENLELFCKIMNKTDIKYGLIYGTLLGAVREKNFIEHDEDSDVFVLHEYKDRFLRLIPEFKEVGITPVRYIDDVVSLMRNDDYIDVFFFKKKKKYGLKKIRSLNNDYEIDAKYLENTVQINFLGFKTYIPEKPEDLLKKVYGKDWRIPIKNCNAKPNALHTKLRSLFFWIQKIPYYKKIFKPIYYVIKKI